MIRFGWIIALAALAFPADAAGQTSGFVDRVEVSGAVGYFTPATLGTAAATLRPAATSGSFTLFTTDSTLAGSATGQVGVGVWLTRRVEVEGRMAYGRPRIETSVRADAEGAAPITVVERIHQFTIDGGLLVRLDEMRMGRLLPYAAGGAGYLRQIHEGLALIEQGHVYHLGGGVIRDLFTRTHGVIRAASLRVDARVYLLSGGVSLNDGTTTHGSFSAGFFIRF